MLPKYHVFLYMLLGRVKSNKKGIFHFNKSTRYSELHEMQLHIQNYMKCSYSALFQSFFKQIFVK